MRWSGPRGTFALKKITLLNAETHTSTLVNPVVGSLEAPARWRRAGEINAANSHYDQKVKAEDVGAAVVYENLRARPRAWLVPEVTSLAADDVFNAIRSSRLPDGRAFDPARLALIEEPFIFKTDQMDPAAIAQVVRLTRHEMEVRTKANGPAFLVTSDMFYPGWHATVDGAPARLYQTDYVLRGVPVPGGTHIVRFEFSPHSFYYGVGLSALSLFLLVGCALWPFRGRQRRKDKGSKKGHAV